MVDTGNQASSQLNTFAQKLVEEAEKKKADLVSKAGSNAIKKLAAEKAGDALVAEAKKQGDKLIAEAEKKAGI